MGNTVVVIEHNLDVIKSADWVIDLGPEGGEEGGRIICQGTPEELIDCPDSSTGFHLKKHLTRQITEVEADEPKPKQQRTRKTG